LAHILVVDDDPTIRSNTARVLTRNGHTIAEAGSSDEAMALIAQGSIDLVIMDVVMPEKGGIEAMMEIHSRYPDIPAVIMSGKVPLGNDAIDGLMSRYGSRAVLSKPFTGDELLSAVETALAGSS
jgi:CheY-like chemotaxis protein